MFKRIKENKANATTVLGIFVILMILLLSIFIVDLTMNVYMRQQYKRSAQTAVQTAIKEQDFKGALSHTSVNKAIQEYKIQTNPNLEENTDKPGTQNTAPFRRSCQAGYPTIKITVETGADNEGNTNKVLVYDGTGYAASKGKAEAFKENRFKAIKMEVTDVMDNFGVTSVSKGCSEIKVSASARISSSYDEDHEAITDAVDKLEQSIKDKEATAEKEQLEKIYSDKLDELEKNLQGLPKNIEDKGTVDRVRSNLNYIKTELNKLGVGPTSELETRRRNLGQNVQIKLNGLDKIEEDINRKEAEAKDKAEKENNKKQVEESINNLTGSNEDKKSKAEDLLNNLDNMNLSPEDKAKLKTVETGADNEGKTNKVLVYDGTGYAASKGKEEAFKENRFKAINMEVTDVMDNFGVTSVSKGCSEIKVSASARISSSYDEDHEAITDAVDKLMRK